MAFRSLSNIFGKFASGLVDLSPEVKTALCEKKAIVALESTIISHGMPFPHNYETALSVENIIRDQGAIPATIAVLGGRIKVGMNSNEIQELADPKLKTVKISRRDLAYVLANKLSGGTTVSGTLLIANKVGINIFVTGGIGGVHRSGETTFDISADLIELGKTPSMVVSSGVKSILDIGKTLEYLETQGVCVVTYGPTKDFPAFYSEKSGFDSVYNVNTPEEAARLLYNLKEINLNSGILLAVPIPSEYAIPNIELESTIKLAVAEAEKNGVRGKNITPYILEKVSAKTQGKSLKSSILYYLLVNNYKGTSIG
ncbi:hypothetical protein AAG570_000359 [Ranatra chinensis]|uniref:Pseudouridine-5'-phosphate glycosidase n=1 Tax=Ranatra chinensis TaxID=642074 RepID=A0ABD0Z790_9HEMI